MDTPVLPQQPQNLGIQEPQTSLSTPQKSFSHTILSIVGIALFLTAIGYLGYQNWQLKQQVNRLDEIIKVDNAPMPSPTSFSDLYREPNGSAATADWEIYTNIENGYSLKYPNQGLLRLICPGEELTVTNDGVGNQVGPVEMSTCARGGRYTLETKTYNSIQPEPEKTKYYTVEGKSINLSGIQAKQYIFTFTNVETGPFPFWYTLARVNKNGKTYEIYFDEKESLYIFDQILSTFRFLDQKSYSQECEVCGPKGLHNVEGKTCTLGLECKSSDNGVVNSVSFCVKPRESIQKCL
ncbi:hypothetical protein HY409_02120 [Candidatus Gottesmanbacteria bacterium]|nr:hypothetical protein [Candidatus Gottesmanbacteria bacterium]